LLDVGQDFVLSELFGRLSNQAVLIVEILRSEDLFRFAGLKQKTSTGNLFARRCRHCAHWTFSAAKLRAVARSLTAARCDCQCSLMMGLSRNEAVSQSDDGDQDHAVKHHIQPLALEISVSSW